MAKEELGLGTRLVIGGIAGFVATLAMTSAMRHLHKRLPRKECSPPPSAAPDLTLALHFAYGAGCGALLAAADPRIGRVGGALAGGALWLVSYMGWVPAFGVLRPASGHPLRRDALTIGAHFAWGWSTAEAMRELLAARATILADGPDRDAASPSP